MSPLLAISSSVLLPFSILCFTENADISSFACNIVPPPDPEWLFVVETHNLLSGDNSKSIG